MKEWKVQLGEKEYPVRELTTKDINQILDLQSIVIEMLEDRDFLQPLSREEVEGTVYNRLMVGLFAEKQLVAFRTLQIPVMDEHHLGLDIGLDKNQLPDVVYQEITIVHPDFRGYGLQKKLGHIVMELLADSPYSIVCATVAPFNIPSLKDKLSQGMKIGALKPKYRNMLRYVFYKNIKEQEDVVYKQQVEVRMADAETQQSLLKDGWVGVEILLKENEWHVVYRK